MFDKVVIVDKSVTTEVAAPINLGAPTAYFPIFSGKGFGRDSQVKFFSGNTQANLITKYGAPDLTNYLEPIYYAYEFIRGGGNAYVRRIVSSTSTLSHAVILAKGKLNSTTSKYEVKFEIKTIASSTSIDAVVSAAEALYSNVADTDGYLTYPIAVLSLLWTGSEGNKYTFRLVKNTALEATVDERCYTIEMKPNAMSEAKSVEFSVNDCVVDGVSIYANDIFETSYPDATFQMLTGYKTFLTAIDEYIPTTESFVDIFFGIDKTTNAAYPNYTIVGTSVDFTQVGGIALAGGGDGTFATTNATRVDAMMTALADSFAEDATKKLTNEYKYFIDFVFDFGAPAAVKTALVSFANSRLTTSAILDVGTTATKTKSAILTARKTGDATWNNKNITLVSGVGSTIDMFTTKKTVKPLSYFEAFAIPNHINKNDRGSYPFAGNRYQYSNMLADSYSPEFYTEDSTFDEFKANKIVFATEDSNGYTAAINNTSLMDTSDLDKRNNMYLLHRLIRICLLTAKEERFNFAETSDISKYELKINRNISFQMDGLFGDLKLTAEREGTYGPSKNRVKINAYIRFKYTNEGTTFNFTVVGTDSVSTNQ